MRATRRALVVAALIASALACGRDAPPVPVGRAVRDDLGRTVVVPVTVTRVLSLAPSNTELMFALGAGQRLVGRTDADDFPPEAAAVPSVGSLFPPDDERIVATRPDLVLMIDGNADLRQRLAERGLPVVVFQPRTLDGILDTARRLGSLLGREAAAEALVARLEAQRRAVLTRLPADRPRVFYEVWSSPLTAAGPATFVGDLVRTAGGRNALGADLGDWPRLDVETLLAADPDVLLLSRPGARAEVVAGQRPGYSVLRAVSAGRVIEVVDPDLLERAGPRAFEGLAWLAAALHPQAFGRAP